jgi:predicted ATPase
VVVKKDISINTNMDIPKIRVKTEGFRAIGSADIIIDGITVVAGENACGKSTLSKLLYYLYKMATNYDLLVAQSLRPRLENVSRVLDVSIEDLDIYSHDRKEKYRPREEFHDLLRSVGKLPMNEESRERWLSAIRKIANAYSEITDKEGHLFKRPHRKRVQYILNELLGEKDNKNDIDDEEQSIPWGKLIDFVESIFKEAFGKMNGRPVSLFNDAFKRIFRESELPKTFDVFELDECIVSIEKSNLSIPYLVQNTIYIDTPMMIGIAKREYEYWDDLNELLKKQGDGQIRDLSKIIDKEIIEGEVSVDQRPYTGQFYYKRSDGAIFNLFDVATGIKAFGIIELLLNNGSLTDKTLLIIDEPESNLHPQWIIEYARLIVLLNKQLGVKFFIATHNPDMVSALKYISAKEAIDRDLNFYLAEPTDSKRHLYSYKHLGTDIDPIFASFNIALDRINQYGI